MKPALLLLDLQQAFLARPGLQPDADTLNRQVALLLEKFRLNRLAVIHVRTQVASDGKGCMPHWKKLEQLPCVEGSFSAAAPEDLVETAAEPVFYKQFFSAFSNPELLTYLRSLQIDTLVVAGLYTHACIRSTVLDAYARQFEVVVAEDAVGATDALHALLSRQWLESRASRFVDTDTLLRLVGIARETDEQHSSAERVPVAFFNGQWVNAGEGISTCSLEDPVRSGSISCRVPNADNAMVDTAADACARRKVHWSGRSQSERAALLGEVAKQVVKREAEFVALMIREIGKPHSDALEEIRRAVAHIYSLLELFAHPDASVADPVGVQVAYRPLGTVALLTPWNNPLAIPLSKIAAALLFGNTVLWKPAVQAPRTAMAVMQCLCDGGIPYDVVTLVFGEAATARTIAEHSLIDGVSLTGATDTGRVVAGLCSRQLKPLQAELGGNNSAIVMNDCSLAVVANRLVRAAFGFAGQRCTAIRRFIVLESAIDEFCHAARRALVELEIGKLDDAASAYAPLVSRARYRHVEQVVDQAVRQGCRIIARREISAKFAGGNWFPPTILFASDSALPVVQQETFGPVAVLQPARDFQHALELANGVSQGLVACIYTADKYQQDQFKKQVRSGLLRINPETFHVQPDAPFNGFGTSSLGPAEHGLWDQQFYTRPQAIYNSNL